MKLCSEIFPRVSKCLTSYLEHERKYEREKIYWSKSQNQSQNKGFITESSMLLVTIKVYTKLNPEN